MLLCSHTADSLADLPPLSDSSRDFMSFEMSFRVYKTNDCTESDNIRIQ